MLSIRSLFHAFKENYWPLLKSLQTLLLLVTGLAGFISGRCPVMSWQLLFSVSGSLFLAISGSTVLNMWYDRDIDALMQRTCLRPLPSGKISPRAAFTFGLVLAVLGVAWALNLNTLYGIIVFSGLFFDVVNNCRQVWSNHNLGAHIACRVDKNVHQTTSKVKQIIGMTNLY